MKFLSIIGTRPQFIKLFPIQRAINNYNTDCKKLDFIGHIVVNTGQHFDKMLSDVFIDELKIVRPKYNLRIKEDSQCLQLGKMISSLEEVLLSEKPDMVLVYGDTNSTLSGALVAKKLNFKLAHIEAGVRSYNRNMPEEVNRILTDRISDILFCPTRNAVNNLKDEGFFLGKNNYRVFNVGDVMMDTFLNYKDSALQRSKIISKIFGDEKKDYILVTIHRAENTDDKKKLGDIFKLLKSISREFPIVFPIHPRTKKMIGNVNEIISNNFTVIDPVSYFDMIKLMNNAKFIITDSGGVQREAYFLKTKCITFRNETEWLETLENNCNHLIGLNNLNVEYIIRISKLNCKFNSSLFGDGNASRKIISILKSMQTG